MSFLNPGLLGFVAAIGVPILIHLLNRRRFQRVSWAAMRFVRASLEKNRRRMQIEDLLLLALRCLVVGLLALALARPALRTAASYFGGARIAGVILLDRSASLSATDGVRSRLESARQAADAAVDGFPAGSMLAVLLVGDHVSAAVPEPTPDLGLVRRVLREAAPSALATDHAVAVAAALEILKGQTALRKEIVLVTDRQAMGWRRLPEIETLLEEAGSQVRFRVLFVGDPVDDNLALTTLTRSAGFAAVRDPLRFQAEVANLGRSTVRQVRVTLHVDGGPAVDEAVLEALSPGESRRVTFFARFADEGFHSVTARLPADRMPADDERTLVVPVVGEVRVLVVDGDPASNSAFFLRNALQPVPAEVAPRYFLQPRVVTPGQMAVTRLADYGAIILADPAPLPASVVDLLARHVAEGGALIVFPGSRAQPGFYNDELLGRAGLLPAALGRRRGDPAEGTPVFHLQASGYTHPLVALWNEGGAGSLAAARFRAAWELIPAPPRTNAVGGVEITEPIVAFADGGLAAVERGIGRGRVILFASTAGTAWNDLAVRPVFVPLLHRAVSALTDAQERRYNLRAGARASVRLAAELADREVSVFEPGRVEPRETLTLRPTAGSSVLEFEGTERAGLHRVTLGAGGPLLALFAAQADPAESGLSDLPPERLAELSRVAQVLDWRSDVDVRGEFERERLGVELWAPAILAVLGLGWAESWLSRRFSRPK